MFSSEDEQDDNNIFDQLRNIRPFTIDQLYLLHPDVGCPPSSSTTQQAEFYSDRSFNQDQEVYQNLVEYEQLRRKLVELKGRVKKMYKRTHDHVDKAWTFNEEATRKIALCQQGKIAETTFKYKQAFVCTNQLENFSLGFNQLIEAISKDYIYYSFESQMKRHKITTKLSTAYQIEDLEDRRQKLRRLLITIIKFMKQLGDTKSDLIVQCRRWFRALAERLLEENSTDNNRFILAQLAKGPAGTAGWASDLIECRPYEQTSDFESVPQYITHCSALLAELFYSLKACIRRVNDSESVTTSTEDGVEEDQANDNKQSNDILIPDDQKWSLVDPRFACTEELSIISGSSILSEADIMKFCLKIPVAQIFRAHVKKCLASTAISDNDEFYLESNKMNYEFVMVKLLTIGTVIIKTYQIGLETFNSIQYGSLIEYLSSQIRRTVIILSENWSEFKARLKGVDDALLLRLQVEYDNFILRSIMIILELRQSGIWRHLSRFEPGSEYTTNCDPGNDGEIEEGPHSWSTDSFRPAFAKLLQVTGLTSSSQNMAPTDQPCSEQSESENKDNRTGKQLQARQRSSINSLTYEFSIEWFREVSEPMLWHILWQFYHNAFVTSCDYNSDNFWLEKFQGKSVVYLFVKKIKDSPPAECSYLLNSITSMLLSRTQPDSKLIKFIATEIFNLSYRQKTLKVKITKKGTGSLIRSAEKFPMLISLYLSLMADSFDEQVEEDTTNCMGDLSEDVIDLIKGCSLTGWLCNHYELDSLANWLIELPLDSTRNKVSRIVLSKILLNSPDSRNEIPPAALMLLRSPAYKSNRRASSATSTTYNSSKNSSSQQGVSYFVDLKMRRKLALLLFEATMRHAPDQINDLGAQSLGASVEVAFGGLFCEQNLSMQNNLLELATDVTYQQFYVWCWRLLTTLRLHILNQPETDWNDLTTRSGTSRSTRNTVLMNDSFHPVPTVQESECSVLAKGVEKENPTALFIYLMLTDATWQADTFEKSLTYLNVLVNSGHITPSLMVMKFFTICHLNELNDLGSKDKKCLEYFTTLVSGNLDATRLASLIMSQLDRLKQFRQLQLSQFYVHIFLEVASIISRQISSSWFTSSENSLDKIACLLDYLVKFNFTTQRMEIIHKFYDCAYTLQDGELVAQTGWFGSFFASNTINATVTTKREFLTNLHALSQKFKKYFWLRWMTTECDTLRLEKIWEDIVGYLSSNEDANLDAAIRKVCPQVNSSILRTILPIYSWIDQIFDIMESDLNHPLCPLIWYNFFLNYFANSLNGTSVGYKLVQQETTVTLMTRLDSLFNYHLYKQRNWSIGGQAASNISAVGPMQQQNSLARLYRAYKLWLQDSSLRDAYVDMDKLRDDYLVLLLKAVMESSSGSDACLQYIDVQSIGTQNKNLTQVWLTATKLTGNHLIREMIFVDSQGDDSMEILTSIDDEASDATLLLLDQNRSSGEPTPNNKNASKIKWSTSVEEELTRPPKDDLMLEKYRTIDELFDLTKKNFHAIFEEANLFNMNISELSRTKMEIIDLVKLLYKNKKREFLRVVACSDGNECIGPARIKMEAEEAMMDERKSHCIQDRRRQCQELLGELLLMPKNRSIQSIVLVEQSIKRLIDDPTRARHTVELLLRWMSESTNYQHLNGNYYVAQHLLKTSLEILSTSEEIDTYNSSLVEVCLQHPDSVQVLSPHLKPTSCSYDCFLSLYKMITGNRQKELGPMATFVLLSKFDISHWLDTLTNKQEPSVKQTMHHDLLIATCSALQQLGKDPDESYELAMGLFRRHLQVELALPDRRRPEELMLVLKEFLRIMSEQQLAPKLWIDFMAIMGLERRHKHQKSASNQKSALVRVALSSKKATSISSSTSNHSLDNSSVMSLALGSPFGCEHDDSTIESLVDNVTRQAENQTIFDYHSLCAMVELLSEYMKRQDDSTETITLLELYSDYLDKYASFMLSVTFMWIRSTSEQYPDNHELIWGQFMELWYDWVFLQKNCQNVSKPNYSLMTSYFVVSIRYMISKLPDNTQQILQSVLFTLASYIDKSREVVYLELTILQRSLKNLPWSNLIASLDDFEYLCALSEQENYNISDLVSHILLQIDVKKSLSIICQQTPEVIPRVSERLATTIIMQSTHLKGYRLQALYFTSIPIGQISTYVNSILPRMEFVNLEHNQNNKLLVNLLRFTCIKWDTNSAQHQDQEHDFEDGYKRALVYGQFVSSYLIDLIKRYPTVVSHNQAYLAAVLDNSLQDLKPLLLSSHLNLTQKTIIYESLLECCSSDLLDLDQRLMLSKLLIESNLLKNRPLVVLEILHAIGQILRDGRVLVETVEELILMYLNMNGHYEKVWRSFCLKVLPSDIYLNACVELGASLAMLVYFESLARGKQLTTPDQLDASGFSADTSSQGNSNISASTTSNCFNSNRIWSSFFHWLGQMISSISSNATHNSTSEEAMLIDTKLIIVLPRMLELLNTNLQQFTHGILQQALVSDKSSNANATSQKSSNINQQNFLEQAVDSNAVPSRENTAAEIVSTKSYPSPNLKQPRNQQSPGDLLSKLQVHHQCLLELIRQLLSMYDSLNAGGIWSYLSISASKNEHSARVSITALAVATFLVDKTLANLSHTMLENKEMPEHLLALRQEMTKYHRACMSKLEAARKSKNFVSSLQFIETMIECSQHGSDKVHYMEGVQLITTFIRLAFSRPKQPNTSSSKSTPGIEAILLNPTASQKSSSNLSTEAKVHACLSKILPNL